MVLSSPPPAGADEANKPLPPPVIRPGPRTPTPAAPGAGTPAGTPAPLWPAPEDRDGPPPRPPAEGGSAAPARPSLHPSGLPGGLPGEEEPPPRPGPPPPRPTTSARPEPGDFVFEVERPGGLVHRFDESEDVAVLAFVGNPRLHASPYVRLDGRSVPEVSIKANYIILWIDLKVVTSLEAFQGMGLGKAPSDEPAATDDPAPREKPAGGGSSAATLFQEGVLAIYAEGACELKFGDLVFRAERLYLEPRTYRGMLVEPRLKAFVQGQDLLSNQRLPIYLRARRGRLVAEGLTVFDDADLTTSLADDRIELSVKRVTVEEYAQLDEEAAAADEPKLLGYRSFRTQRLRAESVVTRAERVPLFYWGSAELGPAGGEAFPVRIRGIKGGKRTSFGWWGTVGVGGLLGPAENPWVDWTARVYGYQKRGIALAAELDWDRRFGLGSLDVWGIEDQEPVDRDDFVPPDPFRWRVVFANRTQIARDLVLDAEFADFSDAGVNQEFFERENLDHKDYETNARLKWTPGNAAFTLVGKPHVRDFVTETTELPQASLWVASVPLLEPAYRGGVGLDVTSVTRSGWLERRFAEPFGAQDYEAFRAGTDTLVNLGVDLGDVRFTSWAGPSAVTYLDRTDGGPDMARTALLLGARANLQLWKVFPARGGLFQLDGLRHVVDLDVAAGGRFFDSARPDEVPYFDRVEEEEQRSTVNLRARNRLQTHARGGGLRSVFDFETLLSWYPDKIGPYGRDTPGAIDLSLRAQPREALYLGGEGTFDFGDHGFETGFLGVGWRPRPDLALFTGLRYLRNDYLAPVLDLAWRWSEKYGVRFYESYDTREGVNFTRLLFRRYSPDHIIQFGVSLYGEGDASLELSLEPAIGGRKSGSSDSFKDEPDLDPWRAFPGVRR